MRNKTVLGWLVFYLVVTVLVAKTEPQFDLLIYPFLCVVVMLLPQELPVASVWLFGLASLGHIAGVFPLKIASGSLYGLIQHYDTGTHFFGFLFIALGFWVLFFKFKKNITKLDILILLVALIGLGSLIEVSEYTGYRLFGIGEGWIKFGPGDNSMNFGPWGDSMTDSLANIFGVLFGSISYYIYRKITRNIYPVT